MLADFDNLSPLLADLVMEAGYHAIDILFDQVSYVYVSYGLYKN